MDRRTLQRALYGTRADTRLLANCPGRAHRHSDRATRVRAGVRVEQASCSARQAAQSRRLRAWNLGGGSTFRHITVGKGIKIILAIVIGIIPVGIGILMCFTIILVPLGIPLVVLGGYPLYRVLRVTPDQMDEEKHVRASTGEVPWYEQEGDIIAAIVVDEPEAGDHSGS